MSYDPMSIECFKCHALPGAKCTFGDGTEVMPHPSRVSEAIERAKIAARSEFKLGDVVRLKSGGPSMTIVEILDTAGLDGMSVPRELARLVSVPITCAWYVTDGHLVTARFRRSSLTT